jgi:hypothetical protein
MDHARDFTEEQEERRRAWIEKSRQRERATAQRIKVFGLIFLVIFAIGVSLYCTAFSK